MRCCFFVGRPESQSNDSSEIEDLERALNACAQKPIKKVIVVSSTYVYKKKEGNSVVLITIHEAEFDQMSMSFENLFKITGHFVSTSLLHKLQAHKEEMTAPLIQTIENALNEERKSHRE